MRSMRQFLGVLAVLPLLLAGPAMADNQHKVMAVAVNVVGEGADEQLGNVRAVRLLDPTAPSYERCRQGADLVNSRQKVQISMGGTESLKWQFVCYKASATVLEDIALDICGKALPLYVRTCQFLVYKKPILRKAGSTGSIVDLQ